MPHSVPVLVYFRYNILNIIDINGWIIILPPADMDEMALAQMVGIHGDIATLKIVRDKMTRKSKGYAFVEMVDEEGAPAAAEALNKTVLGDKILDVKPAM